MKRAKSAPDRAEAAVAKYQEFNRYEPKKILERKLEIPLAMYRGGPSKWVTYRSQKVDPTTLQRPSRPLNYIHEHGSGVVTHLAQKTRHSADRDVDVPQRFRSVAALVRLGHCLGFCFEDPDGQECEVEGTHPLPDLYATPDGKCLLVIQSMKTVLAMMWGGALGVYARGIDG